MKTKHLVPTLLFASLLISAPATAAPPGTLAVHGVLSAAGGGPVADGDYKVRFALYKTDKDAAPVWTEGEVLVGVKSGRFTQLLGTLKPMTPAMLAGLAPGWLGLKVGTDPELPRVALTSVPWSLVAAQAADLACSGCIGETHLAANAVTADRVAFAWAAAKTKGGAALSALDLECTGCVSVSELKPDGDLDLGGNAIKAKAAAIGALQAGSIAATSYVGDGSKLTGIAKVSGDCKVPGEVISGIAPDGSLKCVKVATGDLPPDALDNVSGGLLTNEFSEAFASANTPVAIPDNNPTGVGDELIVPDIGNAKSLRVLVKINNSDIKTLTVELFDPGNTKYVLFDKNGAGKVLEGTWPTPLKPVSGDLGSWQGKNPKGKWRLRAIDTGFFNNKTDGEIVSWSIVVDVVSNQKVEAKGKLVTSAGLQFTVAAKPPAPCNTANHGLAYLDSAANALRICNGVQYYDIYLVKPGTKESPVASCQELLTKDPGAKSGTYWLDVDGAGPKVAFEAWCDMTLADGGWTMALNLDTSDGHVMWWANDLWTNAATWGSAQTPFKSDHKSAAWNDLANATEILLVVHEQGAVKGWKRFKKSNGDTMFQHLKGGDNTLIGSSVLAADTAGVWSGERLVRLSTALYANHCVTTGGSCVSTSNAGSPDGDRIGSHQGTPQDNDGGGLGNWHDMAYCCAGKSYAGKTCKSSAFRTVSEAQAGWVYAGQNGTFGTDSFAPMTGQQNDNGCSGANWAKANAVAYDYAIYLR